MEAPKTQEQTGQNDYAAECLICGNNYDQNQLVSYDNSKTEYHLYCLYPSLRLEANQVIEKHRVHPNYTSEYQRITELQNENYKSLSKILKKDMEKINQLLIHACYCGDTPSCSNEDFKTICPYMHELLLGYLELNNGLINGSFWVRE